MSSSPSCSQGNADMGTKEMSATIGVDTFAILGFSIFQGEQLSEFWGSGSYGEQTVPPPVGGFALKLDFRDCADFLR